MTQVIAAAIVLAVALASWQVLAIVRRIVERRSTRILPRLLRVFEQAVLFYGCGGAAMILLPLLREHGLSVQWEKHITTILLTAITAVVVARLFREWLQAGISQDRAAPFAASFVQNIVYAAVYVLALIIILATLGVNISAMIAAIGAGSLVIGLALQETLANFFAGLYILLTGKVKVGDYVLFDSFDGTVEDITWRTTILRRASNAVLIVPNQRMSSSVLTVFRAGESPIRIRLEILVATTTDLAVAERAIGAAFETFAVDGFMPDPPPVIRIADTTSFGINLHVWVSALNVRYMFDVRTAAMRACITALQRENIQFVVLRQ